MFYSNKYNLLYIASPKSGSTSVEKYLFSIDPEGENHSITLKEKKITNEDMYYGVAGHARAWEFKEALGSKTYNKINTLGFVRHPLEKAVSTYHFNKKLSLISPFKYKGKKNRVRRISGAIISRLMSRLLPISIWVILFPMKTSFEYFHDKNGERIVDYLGRTSFLEEDLRLILNEIGIELKGGVPHENKTSYSKSEDPNNTSFLNYVINKKYGNDVQFYNSVCKEINDIESNIQSF